MYHYVHPGETLHYLVRNDGPYVHHLISSNPTINPNRVYPSESTWLEQGICWDFSLCTYN